MDITLIVSFQSGVGLSPLSLGRFGGTAQFHVQLVGKRMTRATKDQTQTNHPSDNHLLQGASLAGSGVGYGAFWSFKTRCDIDTHNDRVAVFHRLHSSGCFVMPNPWDAGSARALEQMGFEALATTSAGFAWTLGRADNQVTLDEVLEHLRFVVDAVTVPVNADFEGGFAVDPEQVHANVKLAVATGIAGLSIEDSTGDEANPLYEFDVAVERVQAARRAIDESGTGVVLTGRSEGFVRGRPDINEAIRRLRAYGEAGADCLYAPRIETVEHVAAIITAVSPKPVNLLINTPFMTVAEAATLGVRRISVGGTLARTAWGGFLQAATEIAEGGTFSRFEQLPNVDALFSNQ